MTTHAHDPAAPARAAVTRTLERLTEAWNAGDAAGYAGLFTEDATYVAFNGESMYGRTQIEQVHRWLFEGPLRGSRLEPTGEEAAEAPPRFIRPGVAVVLQGGGVRIGGTAALAADRASLATLVLIEEDGGDWRITAFHNTRREPQTAGEDE